MRVCLYSFFSALVLVLEPRVQEVKVRHILKNEQKVPNHIHVLSITLENVVPQRTLN